jgi:hypothetical protein
MVDLWPENIGSPEITAPVSILKRQASLLGEKTNNVVEAEVQKGNDAWWTTSEDMIYNFYLVAPALGKYLLWLMMLGCTL